MGKRTIAQLIEAGFIKPRPAPEPKRHGLIKDYCKRGHPMEEWNLYHRKDGTRECKACMKLRQPDRVKPTDPSGLIWLEHWKPSF